MRIIDMHCDTLTQFVPLFKNDRCVDFERMQKNCHYTQFFAIYLPDECPNPMERIRERILFLSQELEKNKLILANSYQDLQACRQENKPAVFLSIENAFMIKNRFDLEFLYESGVRCLSLTWNHANRLAGGALEKDAGLSDFGAEIATYAEALGILIDLSHLNDRSFWELMPLLKKPPVATHSNARAICPHPRNLSDAQILEIIRKKGCVCTNAYAPFLTAQEECTLSDFLLHIEHIRHLGGENHIGFGFDFDGCELLPQNFCGVEDVKKLIRKMEQSGYSPDFIENITHKNVESVLEICL
ncbi:MAG: hypothetical protein E7397_03145 [Ruminococcaceae bacterium]|nr:hypothetical protein [Oscillospiraceae bacterium]